MFLFRHARRCATVVTLLLMASGGMTGQSAREDSGFYLYQRFDGTNNDIGFITRLYSSVGYKFNQYFAVDAGLPVYFVRPSERALSTSAIQRVNGIGNVHLAGRLTLTAPVVNYLSTLTVTAPTGDEDKGLSTGHATYDWSHHFDRSFGRLTPFGGIGIANTVSDTPFFIRPFISKGFVTHLEGGAQLSLIRAVSIGGSAYTIRPSGEQTVISRIRRPDRSTPAGQSARGRGRGQGVFEVNQKTVGPAEIARDHGASLWLRLNPSELLDLLVGYSRSTTYALDTLFFGVGINVGSLIKRGRL